MELNKIKKRMDRDEKIRLFLEDEPLSVKKSFLDKIRNFFKIRNR